MPRFGQSSQGGVSNAACRPRPGDSSPALYPNPPPQSTRSVTISHPPHPHPVTKPRPCRTIPIPRPRAQETKRMSDVPPPTTAIAIHPGDRNRAILAGFMGWTLDALRFRPGHLHRRRDRRRLECRSLHRDVVGRRHSRRPAAGHLRSSSVCWRIATGGTPADDQSGLLFHHRMPYRILKQHRHVSGKRLRFLSSASAWAANGASAPAS